MCIWFPTQTKCCCLISCRPHVMAAAAGTREKQSQLPQVLPASEGRSAPLPAENWQNQCQQKETTAASACPRAAEAWQSRYLVNSCPSSFMVCGNTEDQIRWCTARNIYIYLCLKKTSCFCLALISHLPHWCQETTFKQETTMPANTRSIELNIHSAKLVPSWAGK